MDSWADEYSFSQNKMEKNRKKRAQNFPKKIKFQKQKFVHKNNLQKSKSDVAFSKEPSLIFVSREKKRLKK